PRVLTLQPIRPATSPLFFFNDTSPTEIYTLSLHDALPISQGLPEHWTSAQHGRFRSGHTLRDSVDNVSGADETPVYVTAGGAARAGEHTSEIPSLTQLPCPLLLFKKKTQRNRAEEPANDCL